MSQQLLSLSISLDRVQSDLPIALAKCQVRGLVHSATWLAELLLSTQQNSPNSYPVAQLEGSPGSLIAAQYSGLSCENFSKYNLARCYFDIQEYARCAHLLASIPKHNSHPLIDFLQFYSRYLSIEKHMTDDSITNRDTSNYAKCGSALPSEIYRDDLSGLKSDMEQRYCDVEHTHECSLDAFLSSTVDVYTAYVYALVQIRLGFQSVALKTLVHLVKKDPLLWPAWSELVNLFEDREKLDRFFPPSTSSDSSNWMLEFFRAKALLHIQESERALSALTALSNNGFHNSLNLQADIADAHERLRDLDTSVEIYKKIFTIDPYRLTDTDIFSNVLFVRGEHNELAYLARRCAEIDKYKPETCCVLGNFYGLRSQHDKAVLYFQRALRLQPRYALVWILLGGNSTIVFIAGHEYVELQHLKLAIYAYNQAILHNRHDHRGWYGLGQLYEFIKQPEHALYYYKRAQYLCPTDSRVIVALGDMYEKLGNVQAAKKCFWRAYCVGDMEGSALAALARCFEKSGESCEAAAAHTQFIRQCETRGVSNEADLGQAYRYLANYHFKHGHHNDAVIAINKCLDFPEIREEAKALCLQLTLLSGSAPSTSECQASEKLAISLGNSKANERDTLTSRPRLKARRRLKQSDFTSNTGDVSAGSTDFADASTNQTDDADFD
ncbi:unnamed protein product [Hydatigera taeniaeformis]|uniref:TPR_REGION domain-containing protein n=1 Tax=Hydatigena taeniaeformis TaxID=6205 RepID=A0A0R3WZH9_HYDTA|nr:unnamed protein product [Hydatigera taeniaeformis]